MQHIFLMNEALHLLVETELQAVARVDGDTTKNTTVTPQTQVPLLLQSSVCASLGKKKALLLRLEKDGGFG